MLKGGVTQGDNVVVQGVGPIGLACVAVCREAGAALVVAAGLSTAAQRLEPARAFGADATSDVEREDPVERLRESIGGELAAIVVDVTGSGTAVRTALGLVRPQGTMVNGEASGDETRSSLPLDATLEREVQLQGACTFEARAVRRVLRLAQKGKYPFERLVTHQLPLEQATTRSRRPPARRQATRSRSRW